MPTKPPTTRYSLAKRELLALSHAQGVVVDCLDGEIWITADGEAGDLILGAGERARLAGSTHVIVSALRPSLVAAAPCVAAASPVRRVAAHCVAALVDRIARWRHPPLTAYPATRLR
jgi:hypothetical protein